MGIVLMLLFAAMVMIAQNFYRYNLLITPVMFAGAFIFLGYTGQQRWQSISKIIIMFVIVVGFIAVDLQDM